MKLENVFPPKQSRLSLAVVLALLCPISIYMVILTRHIGEWCEIFSGDAWSIVAGCASSIAVGLLVPRCSSLIIAVSYFIGFLPAYYSNATPWTVIPGTPGFTLWNDSHEWLIHHFTREAIMFPLLVILYSLWLPNHPIGAIWQRRAPK